MLSGTDWEQSPPPLELKEWRKRKREWFAIAFLILLFLALTFAEFKLTKVSTTLPFLTSIFFFGLLNINVIILIALVWLVFRNIGKLFIERRRRVLGARLKTKLVVAFVSFSIIPTLVLFFISAIYINSSFDRWFSVKIQNTLQTSLEITRTYYLNTEHTAMHFADHIAAGLTQQPAILPYLKDQRELLALDSVEYYQDPLLERLLAVRDPAPDLKGGIPRLSLDVIERGFSNERFSVIQHVGTGDLIRCLVPVRSGRTILGVVVVSSYIPVGLVNKVEEIAGAVDEYRDINPLKAPMKATYLLILVMITLVIIFVAIWMGLYLARELTGPVERLVYGAQAVGSGNLNVTIPSYGHDEIATLVESFNRMTRDLRDNRQRLLQASSDSEKRQLQLEAVLANVSTGVVAIDHGGRITTFNPAAANLLDVLPVNALGKTYPEVFLGDSKPLVDGIERALESALASGLGEAIGFQWTLRTQEDRNLALNTSITPILENSNQWGAVLVVDDLTPLIKGQREMAWREVARRIAHEIKNPLTPIKLSAQRLQRRFAAGNARPEENLALLKECTETIIKHTDELKEMVNEFSNFARLPEAHPAPHQINDALVEVVTLYRQAHPDIQFECTLESKLPIFEFDREQFKRVVINLIDNAVAALQDKESGLRHSENTIQVSTHYHDRLQIAVIEVADNGPGMTDEVKNRIFEPYFSTKREGTGLGLAIAKRIINDHDGFVRVSSAPGEGTKFVIELPTSGKPHSFHSS